MTVPNQEPAVVVHPATQEVIQTSAPQQPQLLDSHELIAELRERNATGRLRRQRHATNPRGGKLSLLPAEF